MTQRVLGPSGSKRRSRRLLTLVALFGAALTVFFVAASGATLSGSTFDAGNGTLTDTTDHDWNPAGSPTGNVGPIETITCPSTIPGTGTNCGLDLVNSGSDESFGQGSKNDTPAPTVVSGQIPPNKDDLSRFYVNQERATDDFLFLAWERSNLLGSAHMDFEFNQLFCDPDDEPNDCSANNVTPDRSEGDFLIDFDFGGSGVPALNIHRWITADGGHTTAECEASNTLPCWDEAEGLGAHAEASVNTAPVTDHNPPGAPRTLAGETKTSGPGGSNVTQSSTFGEAGINLTESDVFPQDECVHFGSAYVKSRSSGQSFTSELKDFIAPVPVNISNCGTVIIRKVTVPSGDATNSFGYTTDVVTGPATTTSPFSLKDSENNTIVNVLQGSYNVTEDDPSSLNYTLSDIDCEDSSVPDADIDIDVDARTVDFDIDPNETLDCTFTNTKNKNNPSATTAPSVIPQDSATVSGLDTTGAVDGAADKKMTFTLWSTAMCTGTALYSKEVTVTANTTYKTDNSGDPAVNSGYSITADGTFYWKVVYNGDSRNNPFTIACGAERVQVDLTPHPSS